MAVSPSEMERWCRVLLGERTVGEVRSLESYLSAVPRLESLASIPSGTPVLVRGDVDAKPGKQVGDGDVRLRSMRDTLEFGRQKGWKQIIVGHIGRKPEGSLDTVARRLGEILGTTVPLVSDWLDEASLSVPDHITDRIAQAAPGSVLVLENTRRYKIERALWDAKPEELPELAPKLATFANSLAEKVATVYVNEALSAGNLDSSSTVVPAAMQHVALGKYVAAEFDGPMRQCLATQFVIFSGLKIDKLDDLEAMIGRGSIKYVLTAGSLAMALAKAAAELDGRSFSMGVAEDPSHADKPYYIPRQRVEQAKAMLAAGRAQGIWFILPVDFVLEVGQVSDTIGPGHQQFDVGPKSSALFDDEVGKFLAASRAGGASARAPVVFYNGVFGMFEDARFEEGTRRFIGQLKRMKDAGALVYVGGGEGGTALEKYGQPDWVTHTFTAGGTVLNALSAKPVPYLQALRMAAATR